MKLQVLSKIKCVLRNAGHVAMALSLTACGPGFQTFSKLDLSSSMMRQSSHISPSSIGLGGNDNPLNLMSSKPIPTDAPNVVTALYIVLFKRAPDNAALHYWADPYGKAILGPVEIGALAGKMYQSQKEFLDKNYGFSNDTIFVESLYAALANSIGGRTPGPRQEEIAFWSALAAPAPGSTSEALAHSAALGHFLHAVMTYNGNDLAGNYRQANLANRIQLALGYYASCGNRSFVSQTPGDAAYVASQRAVVNVNADANTVTEMARRLIDACKSGNLSLIQPVSSSLLADSSATVQPVTAISNSTSPAPTPVTPPPTTTPSTVVDPNLYNPLNLKGATPITPNAINAVVGLYITLFHRVPEKAGADYWLSTIGASPNTSVSVSQIATLANSMISSQLNLVSQMYPTDSEFVRSGLYGATAHVLGGTSLAPLASDASYWEGVVKSQGRAQAVAQFIAAVLKWTPASSLSEQEKWNGVYRQINLISRLNAGIEYSLCPNTVFAPTAINDLAYQASMRSVKYVNADPSTSTSSGITRACLSSNLMDIKPIYSKVLPLN